MLQKYVLNFGQGNLITVTCFCFWFGPFLGSHWSNHWSTLTRAQKYITICNIKVSVSNLKRIWLFWFDKAKEMQKATLIDGQRKLKDFIKKTKSTMQVLESNTAVVSRYFQFPPHLFPFFVDIFWSLFKMIQLSPRLLQYPRVEFSQLRVN